MTKTKGLELMKHVWNILHIIMVIIAFFLSTICFVYCYIAYLSDCWIAAFILGYCGLTSAMNGIDILKDYTE